IKSAKANDNIFARLQSLLQDFPLLQNHLSEDTYTSNVQPLYFKPQLPSYKDPATQFYFLLITAEAQRIFNEISHRRKNWTEQVDIVYNVGNTLNNVKVLAVQTAEELKERLLTDVPNDQSDVIHFALFYLKHNLI